MAKTSCKKGQYYCNTDQKCKPIPDGYKVRKDGFLVSDDNQLYAINKTNGDVVWSHLGNIEELSIIGGSKPVVDEEIIVVSYSSGEIFALNAVSYTHLTLPTIYSV